MCHKCKCGDCFDALEARVMELEAQLAQAQKPAAHDDDDKSQRMKVPQEVRERGWQWRPGDDGDTAFAPPFGTIRLCRVCGCLVAGGPTACVRCVRVEEEAEKKQKPAAPAGLPEVGAPVEINRHGEWVKDKVQRHTLWGGKPAFEPTNFASILPLSKEGDEWRHLPPAQTSREPETPKGVRAAIDEAIRRFGGQADGMFNLANFSQALKAQTGSKDVYDGNLCRVILADRDDVEMCSPGDAHYRLKRPAASPPGEASTPTPNLDKEYERTVGAQLVRWMKEGPMHGAVEADIRAAVAAERERWEKRHQAAAENMQLMRKERDQAIEEIKKDKARIAELEAQLESTRTHLFHMREAYGQEMRKAQEEAAKLAAEVERLKAERFPSATKTNLEALCRYLNDTCSKEPEFYPSADVAGVAMALLVRFRGEVERLRGELERAKAPKRCPADGMTDHDIGQALIEKAEKEKEAGGDGEYGGCLYCCEGAKARELFTPSAVNDPGAKGEG